MIFFTSDLHFRHANILQYTNRPFSSVEEMDDVMIERWNAVVKSTDTVIILGDFTLKRTDIANQYLKRLAGKKCLIEGNHDYKSLEADWDFKTSYMVMNYKGVKLEGGHFPRTDRVPDETLYLHGHSHSYKGTWHDHNQVDLSVEGWNYTPIQIDQLIDQWETLI